MYFFLKDVDCHEFLFLPFLLGLRLSSYEPVLPVSVGLLLFSRKKNTSTAVEIL